LGALTTLVTTIALASAVASGHSAGRPGGPVARGAYSTGCPDPYPSGRDPNNPLMLPVAPGRSDPLSGASFFVDGPAHGAAAGAIARLLGIDTNVPIGHYLPAFTDSDSWATFATRVAGELPQHRGVAAKIRLLEKIASQPEAQRFSFAAEHGTPSGLTDFARKLFCHNFTADPGTIPIISTYFLHGTLKGCPSVGQIHAYMPLFEQQINAIVSGTGNRPVVYLLEFDAIGSSGCIAKTGALGAWEAALRYEVDRFATLPHAVVYVEAGYSDSNGPAYTARVLNAVDVRKIEGFFTNDTHDNWTINEIKWGEKISAMTGGAHFVVNTSDNGNGPLRNPHPVTQGNSDLCNPPGRALGPETNTNTGYKNVDGFLWAHVPGNSSGPCNGGPPSGTFWPAMAERLAARANNRLGPHFPSQPY
jgi:endoglucanase